MRMIIDAHTHIDECPGSPWQDPPETILSLMDEAGISRAVVMTYGDAPSSLWDPLAYVAQAIRRYPHRLIGFARLTPAVGEEACRLLERAIVEAGMKGLKLHPYGYRIPPDSPETLALIQKAAELGAPTLFHCGDEEFTRPLEIVRAAERCPEASIILGHMGGYFHVEAAIECASACPNLYLETSAMPYPAMIRKAVDTIGPERVIFASDGPGCDPRLELDKIEIAGLSEEEKALVLGGNIERLLSGVEGGSG
ncbi:MAG: amidohydrolase [Deltaproteobacteria bacterium]|nr:MAG: amidohydrolase [Deltaproteobacteria bacterium]